MRFISLILRPASLLPLGVLKRLCRSPIRTSPEMCACDEYAGIDSCARHRVGGEWFLETLAGRETVSDSEREAEERFAVERQKLEDTQ